MRFGSAEIYEVVQQLPYIEDTICVGQRRERDTDESVVLFVKMVSNQKLTSAMKQDIRDRIRQARSPRHVPRYIFQVPEIPYTINGKKIEIAVKQIISGQAITPSGAVANPECFSHYKEYVEIERREAEEAKAKL